MQLLLDRGSTWYCVILVALGVHAYRRYLLPCLARGNGVQSTYAGMYVLTGTNIRTGTVVCFGFLGTRVPGEFILNEHH